MICRYCGKETGSNYESCDACLERIGSNYELIEEEVKGDDWDL